MRRKTQEEYIEDLSKINPNIECIGEYKTSNTKLLHRCKICKYEWETKPNYTLQGNGCPVCSIPSKAIGNPPEYRNSIWASDKRYIAEYYGISENIMKSTFSMSNSYIQIKCPQCGKTKKIKICRLLTTGLGCECGDGYSYSEKFLMSLLKQINIKYISQYKPYWSNNKRYDFYLPDYNCIIETHGIQHYTNAFSYKDARTLKDEQANDSQKEKYAKNNGVSEYIIINCSVVNADKIKDNILNSRLPELLQFSSNDIDWYKCDIDAINSKMIECAKLWDLGLTVKEISEKMNINPATINHWLKNSSKLNLCNYNKAESFRRTGDKRTGNNNAHSKSVNQYDIEGNFIKQWSYMTLIQQELGINISHISQCCREQRKSAGGFIWRYADDITTEDIAV